ncbi:MAG: hypothetical protein CVV04_06375 [Firmicutes bacterium HGW-Firmicutes-9]|jgi:hypothetical protein|nr:MAG: hypothetical protein CVV04_06375 [Firmicutes bacterium HGW-Firmicutes-9]
MEPLFTNTCAYSKKNLQEAMFALNKRKRILISLFCLFSIAGCIYNYIIWYDYLFIIMAFGLLALLLFKYVYQIMNKAKVIADRCILLYHEVPIQTVRFFDDRLEPVSIMSKEELSFEYTQIIRVEKSKRLYVLFFNGKVMIILDKSKFDNITLEEFERFIREKAVNAKVLL